MPLNVGTPPNETVTNGVGSHEQAEEHAQEEEEQEEEEEEEEESDDVRVVFPCMSQHCSLDCRTSKLFWNNLPGLWTSGESDFHCTTFEILRGLIVRNQPGRPQNVRSTSGAFTTPIKGITIHFWECKY